MTLFSWAPAGVPKEYRNLKMIYIHSRWFIHGLHDTYITTLSWSPSDIWGINSLRQSDVCMLYQSGPSLVQIMVFHLFGAKPLSEPMLAYCQLDLISMKFDLKTKIFIEENAMLQNGDHFFHLTLNMWGTIYPISARSISCLLKPWLLTSPSHQHPWCWLYKNR